MSDVYEEVVTTAPVRFVEVPGLPGEVALITLENGFDHTKPTTLGPTGLANIDAAITTALAHEPKVRAIAVTGKPFIFAVGADIKGVAAVETREQPLEMGREGHRIFKRLKDALSEHGIPTFAFVNGAVMGGGLEIALHCDYRTISPGVPAVALPECFLGLVPGWGGTQLLPHLIGPAKALTVILENALSQNKMLKGTQALALGIADISFEPADFLAQSLLWAASIVNGDTVVTRPAVEKGQPWQEALARARAFVDAKVKGSAPAPYKALELVALAETASFEEGTAAEDEALAGLVFTEELRASLYSFDLVQRRAKKPVGAPDRSLARPVTKVGVVGAGLMASQLGLLFAQRLQVPVVLTDLDQARLDKGVAYCHEQIDGMLLKGRLNQDKANRLKGLITGSLTKDAFDDADFIIEAVFEELGVKQRVLAELEEHVSPTCVLATNTSSLSVSEMASQLKNPERVVGFHFFNPVAVLPLLEIVRGSATNDATLATAFATGKALRKSSILVKDTPAFVTNRLFMRFFGEVTKAIDEGTPFAVADSALDPLGLPMSPLQLLSFTGLGVSQHVAQTLHDAHPHRFYVSPNLGRLVEQGVTSLFGLDGGINPDAEKLFEVGTTVLTAEQVRQNALDAIADEARRILDEGVVAEAQDVDLALILGGGWPFANGGITPLLDRTGTSEKVTGRRFLAKGIASLP